MIQPKKPLTLEQTELNIGIVALTDCAPIVMAKQLGFYQRFGLNVNLHIQHSWATIRDRLAAGLLDAAQMLAPMPIATSLGLNGAKVDIINAFNLSLNGNGITLSAALIEEIKLLNDGQLPPLPLDAKWLKPLIEKRQLNEQSKLKFAAVYPFSCHYYQLQDWLAAADIDMANDIEVLIIPPANMNHALEANDIDAFCVGTPWNAKAVRSGFGGTLVTSSDIWPDAPEKVLAVSKDWQEQHPNTFAALLAATKLACDWLASTANRFEAAHRLSQEDFLNEPLSVVAPSLIGSCITLNDHPVREVPNYNQFTGAEMNLPNPEEGRMLLSKMQSAGHITSSLSEQEIQALLAKVYRPDLYSDAMGLLAD